MKKILYLLLLVLFWQSGCSSETSTYSQKAQVAPVQSAGPTLNLNNGTKWRADEYTTAGILAMQQAMERFNMSGNINSVEAYQQLGKNLHVELQTTYRQCTMTGQAHNELNKFLIPVEEDIAILLKEDVGASSNAQLRLEERLIMYQTFFE